MTTMEQLQIVVNNMQAARSQVASLKSQVQELEMTIITVKDQPSELALHKQLSGVLIEVADRDALVTELETTLNALGEHLERFSERENQLIETYQELKKVLEGES
jgi:chaperonin cofactor prefoldin|tara:strand:+ start:586 stop:900 length:315 start_codon:yes stop_codon:yes gene_type:complete